jgi:hypothetical protein
MTTEMKLHLDFIKNLKTISLKEKKSFNDSKLTIFQCISTVGLVDVIVPKSPLNNNIYAFYIEKEKANSILGSNLISGKLLFIGRDFQNLKNILKLI